MKLNDYLNETVKIIGEPIKFEMFLLKEIVSDSWQQNIIRQTIAGRLHGPAV